MSIWKVLAFLLPTILTGIGWWLFHPVPSEKELFPYFEGARAKKE